MFMSNNWLKGLNVSIKVIIIKWKIIYVIGHDKIQIYRFCLSYFNSSPFSIVQDEYVNRVVHFNLEMTVLFKIFYKTFTYYILFIDT